MVKKFEACTSVSEHGASDIDIILRKGEEFARLTSQGYFVRIHHIIKVYQKAPQADHPLS